MRLRSAVNKAARTVLDDGRSVEGVRLTVGTVPGDEAPRCWEVSFFPVWSLTGLLSGVAVFLRAPMVGLTVGSSIGPSVLLYGLAAAVWTTNLSRAHRVAQRVDSGIVWVNTWFLRDLRTPFGGVKLSGIGREGGIHSLNFYSELKNICIKL